MPGYKLFLLSGGEVCDELTCSYCKLVLKDPVQTSETGLRLCEDCVDKAQKYVSFIKLFILECNVHGKQMAVSACFN